MRLIIAGVGPAIHRCMVDFSFWSQRQIPPPPFSKGGDPEYRRRHRLLEKDFLRQSTKNLIFAALSSLLQPRRVPPQRVGQRRQSTGQPQQGAAQQRRGKLVVGEQAVEPVEGMRCQRVFAAPLARPPRQLR